MNHLDAYAVEAYPAAPDDLPEVPRVVELTGKARWKRAGLFLALFLAPNLVLLFGILTGEDLRELVQSGQRDSAKVFAKRVESRGRGGRAYLIQYRFERMGNRYEGSGSVSPDEYNRLNVGATCDITCLPSRPQVSCLGPPKALQQARITGILMMAGLIALAVGVGLLRLEFNIRRELHLARVGQGVIGKISDRGESRTNRGTRYWARYRFPSLYGEERTSWHYVPASIWTYLSVGAPVTVLQDTENSGKHCPLYAFRHVRILQDDVPG